MSHDDDIEVIAVLVVIGLFDFFAANSLAAIGMGPLFIALLSFSTIIGMKTIARSEFGSDRYVPIVLLGLPFATLILIWYQFSAEHLWTKHNT